MGPQSASPCDSEFLKLLTGSAAPNRCGSGASNGQIDLVTLALEIARDADPDLRFEPTRQWIADRCGQLANATAGAETETDAIKLLCRQMGRQEGFTGRCDGRSRPEAYYLPEIIKRREGSGLGLSILYLSLASHIRLEVNAVSAPDRFLISCSTGNGRLFVDPSRKGQIFRENDLLETLGQSTGLGQEHLTASLQPASPRTIVIRMLNALKAMYLRKNSWPMCWKVQNRLTSLQPGCWSERRDLAMISVMAQRPDQAVSLLENCLHGCPESERQTLVSFRDEAVRQLAAWN